MKFILFIYILAFLEGFTTLGVEVLAIRNVLHIVGSNIIITSTILGVIILALSVGYYTGGKISGNMSKENIVKKLCANLVIASLFYGFLSFFLEEYILILLLDLIENYFFAIFFTSIIVFFPPVYIASETVPLLSELLEHLKRGEAAGKVLFFSTVGSFLGSILPVIIFVPRLGLNNTIFLVGFILFVGGVSFYFYYFRSIKLWHIIIGGILLSSLISEPGENNNLIYSTHTIYNKIDIYEKNNKRIFSINGGNSSAINEETGKSPFSYIKEAEKLLKEKKPSNVLVIGAAGFSFPQQISEYDFIQNIDVVDIDQKLYKIADKYFLQEDISPKINFFAVPGRYYINKTLKNNYKYDFVFVDAYSSKMSIPNQFLTKQFFQDVFTVGEDVVFNFIMDRKMNSKFSKSIRKTLYNTKEDIYYKNVDADEEGFYANYIFSSFKKEGYKKNKYNKKETKIYSDNKNHADIDKYKLFYEKVLLP